MSKIYESKTAASTYDTSRKLPEATKLLWMHVISELVPANSVNSVLDLGGGTGRFSFMLNELYECHVVTTDPSVEMLKPGIDCKNPAVSWILSKGENLPFQNESFDLVFMSQVYHHIENKEQALNDIRRILTPEGNLLVRNGTYESDMALDWHDCFPGVREFDEGRIPYSADIENSVSKHGFTMLSTQMVNQIIASSYDEYYDKISQRGLSALIAISDEAFETGLKNLRIWTVSKPKNTPVPDPVAIFHFRKT